MVVAIYSKGGKLLLYMSGEPDQIALNVPKGGRFEEVPLERMMGLRDRLDEPKRSKKKAKSKPEAKP